MTGKMHGVLLLMACMAAAGAGAQALHYDKELTALRENIDKHFYIRKQGLYKETAHPEKNARAYSYMWPLCALLQAGNEMEKLQPRSGYMASLMDAIRKYYNPAAPAPGYASYVMKEGGGTRFYDDNQWIGIAAMDAWFRTRKSQYLETGKEIYRFMMTAYDTAAGGGLYWEEGNRKSKNTCSNGPGIILALQLYRATHEKAFLDTALLLYNWVNSTLYAPSGQYYDHIKIPSGQIGKQRFSYNTGTMLQSNVYLFECTGDSMYLKRAIVLAEGSAAYFLADGKFRDDYWFSAVLLRGYQHLLLHHPDRKYIDCFRHALDDALLHNKNENGLMGRQHELNLVAQGGMLEMLARYTLLNKE